MTNSGKWNAPLNHILLTYLYTNKRAVRLDRPRGVTLPRTQGAHIRINVQTDKLTRAKITSRWFRQLPVRTKRVCSHSASLRESPLTHFVVCG
jgi:hypothetical protein